MNGFESFPGAQSGASHEIHFGDPDRESARALDGTVVVPLVHLGIIEAAGADTVTFLQGQLSNDVRQVAPERAQLSSLNSPKGRLLAVLHVLRRADAVLLELHRDVLEPVLRRLRMYVLRAKVKLDEDRVTAAFGIAGPDAARVLDKLRLPAPEAPLATAWKRGRGVLRRLGPTPRYSVLAPASETAKLWAKARELAEPAGTRAWRLLDILGGVPTIHPQTQDRFVPQMCNLDRLGGISFDKGCYTGQEIVARVHYRGAVKRHMITLRTPDLGLPPGAKLALQDGNPGEVVDSVPHPDGGTLALVVAADGAQS